MFRNAFKVIDLDSPEYPSLLKQIQNPPKQLYIRGSLNTNDICFTIVGTRRPTAYGIECAKYFAAQLSQKGFTIVSGLAFGIDAIAHKTALEHGGKTIAVLGSGINIITPTTNERLGLEIIQQGALISEFPPNTPAKPHHFPQRDRIMSGLSIGTLIIEATERSGALITARNAAEQGREVFAIPGEIFSQFSKGTNKLIQQGAKLVSQIDDILEEFPDLCQQTKEKSSPSDKDSKQEQLILKHLASSKTIELLHKLTKIEIPQLRSVLTLLELKNKVKRRADGKYQLNKR